MTQNTFNPAEVPINYTLNFNQVNLILAGLAELPRKQSEGFYDQFRAVALQALKAAEDAQAIKGVTTNDVDDSGKVVAATDKDLS